MLADRLSKAAEGRRKEGHVREDSCWKLFPEGGSRPGYVKLLGNTIFVAVGGRTKPTVWEALVRLGGLKRPRDNSTLDTGDFESIEIGRKKVTRRARSASAWKKTVLDEDYRMITEAQGGKGTVSEKYGIGVV